MEEGVQMKTASVFDGALKFAQAAITPISSMSMKRLELCNQCPNLDVKSRRCKICTCWVDQKVKLINEACPDGKW